MAVHVIAAPPSGNIVSISWDDETLSLFVEFKRQAIYRYYPVSEDIANGFSQSLSANSYFEAFIRNSFEFERMS